MPEHKSMTEEISGLIERVTFHNDESGFCFLRVRARGAARRDNGHPGRVAFGPPPANG